MPELTITYSWWTILLVIGLGLVYAGLLYTKNRKNKLSTALTVILFIFRFSTVSLLVFLLLSPTIKTKRKQIEKPIIIFGQDNSRSILMSKSSLYSTDSLANDLNSLMDELATKNDVDSYLFGEIVNEGIHPDYGDNVSNYSDFFKFLKQNYSGLNVGGVVLVGDGIVNNGIDPVYAASDITYPVFTIALGDTSQSRDLKIDDVRYNSIVYSGDIFPIEVSISANMLEGRSMVLKLSENSKIIAYKEIFISGENFRKTVSFNVETKNTGKRMFSLIAEPAVGETNAENNFRSIFIDILNSRQKILILANAPHPDIGAIKQSLLKNRNYEVETEYVVGFDGNINNFDLVILHQLPSKRNASVKILRSLAEKEIPTLFILGAQSQLSVFNRHFEGMDIRSAVGSTVSAQFEYNNAFTFFSVDDEIISQLASLPPLIVPLGNYSLSTGSEVFGWQRINGNVTDFPLITFFNNIDVKSGVISGEGLWLWRIHDYLLYNNSTAVDAFVSKAVMFLMAAVDKRQFKVVSKGEYDNSKDVILNAELYNSALELDNSADVNLTLTNESKEKFNFTFSPYDSYYSLNLNKLPVGVYQYRASAKFGKKNYSDAGEFIVQRLDNESKNLNADHRMLSRLATEHEGLMFNANEVNKLLKEINARSTMTSKVHYDDKFTGINTLYYILAILILLLSVEWFMRKYFGTY